MKKYVAFMGPIAAGKGTQADIMAQKHGYIHLATGNLFRSFMHEDTELGRKVRIILESGLYVPDQMVNDVVGAALNSADLSKGVIFDGYPRTLAQTKALDEILAGFGITLEAVVVIDLDESKIIERISGRYSCAKCGAIFHDTSNPAPDGRCPICGSKDFVRRKDDRPEAVKVRLERYYTETIPVIDMYEKRKILHRVNGTDGDISSVTKEIEEAIL
ncbi:MAG: nucleoside monophosphate kinase [Rickettsiales bacterium]|jgi:adenylate kinase|nr:nucleoside monophosphate kinase [Rickettsiales bacterium]